MTDKDNTGGPMMGTGQAGPAWDRVEWGVLRELERLNDAIEQMERDRKADHSAVVNELSNVKQEISALKVKAGTYGALSGVGSALTVFAAAIFGGYFK